MGHVSEGVGSVEVSVGRVVERSIFIDDQLAIAGASHHGEREWVFVNVCNESGQPCCRYFAEG